MGEVAYRAPARTSGKVGSETLKATFMEPEKTLVVGFSETLKEIFTEPEKTLERVGYTTTSSTKKAITDNEVGRGPKPVAVED